MSKDPLQYYDQVNPDILYRIPVNANIILEIGCGTGALGRQYKRINPDAIYIGVEIDKFAAKKAEKNIDKVINAGIEEIDPLRSISATETVDCLIFGDVLEHLKDPQTVLKGLLPLLHENGCVLACIPNVQHWSSIFNLLNGQWPQEEEGLFDRTHLRWFTKESIIDLFKNLDLHLSDLHPRICQGDQAREFVKALKPALINLGLEPEELLKGVAPLQYVVKATVRKHHPMIIKGLMLKPQAGLNDVRMIQPLRSVASTPAVRVSLSSDTIELDSANSDTPKIMIWQRQLLSYEEDLPKLKSCLEAGYIMISEFDDDPSHWPQVKANKHLQFRGMHAVQVSTEPLAKAIKNYCPEVHIFPNALEELPIIDIEAKWSTINLETPLRIFFGALNRKNDWREWMPEINKVISKKTERFEFHVIHDREFFESLQTNKKTFYPTCNYKSYLNILSNCHINLLPLADNQFNEMKSDLKFLESAGCAVAVIASPITYAKTIDHTQTGMIISSEQDIVNILDDWHSQPSLAGLIANNAHRWVKANRLQKFQTPERISWYRSLWNRREELTLVLSQST